MDVNALVEKFSVENLTGFFQKNIRTFRLDRENYEYLFDENDYIINNYKDIVKIGEANLSNSDDILVFCAKTVRQLTDRIGKRKQYEIAKKILREENKDAAFFIFYDENGNFRFSLIRVNFLGTKRGFTDFKRYTYFVSPSQTNKTFIKQIIKCDFNNLDSIQEAFSVEPVTKQFYEKLQRWYFWAIKNVKFPGDAEQEPNGREVAIIRLITRIMFVWFMKVRNLIPDSLFDEENIRKILKDVSTEESTYYKAILQNLFFATLNTKQEERKFRSEIRGKKGYNPDFGNHNVFRYQGLFNDPAVLKKLFGNIPFLNGGLFECLDYKTRDENERKYIDGFTATKKHQPIVPDFLFFSEKEEVDISSFFGKEKKTYEVEGLINLLKSYNFTIDENEPDDIEVALDPELLGSIFENLLASYNPETATTARKATGSFYTPREIVNYMTNESLKQYFRQGIGIGSILLPNNEPKQDALDTMASKQDALDTMASKQGALDTFLNPNDEIIIKQGKLPHWTQDNSWYFITFRLADSLPKEKVELLRSDREAWFKKYKKKERNEYTKEELKKYYYLFSERVENWMNAGFGKCVLKNKEDAEIVANAIKHFEGKRYELDEWVVMPNHVHVLVRPFDNYQLSDIIHSWKSFTANKINKNINSNGQLWMHESYDHIVRNEKAFKAIKNYIKQNPEKAAIVSKASSFQEQQTKASSFQEQQTKASSFQEQQTEASSFQEQQTEASSFQEQQTEASSFQEQTSKQDALDTLFDSSLENPFDEGTTKQLIKLINDLRVVDPAVGSGAFPMAMLNKLVFILGKLDPENKQWEQSQIDGVIKSVTDPAVQHKLITQIKKQFKEKNADYGRKLYLIEKCIYGVDIQQIAVEIAKLRFFISLLVDEKIDFDRPENNYGIEPLPNLDFKLMQGNSLISTFAGIDFNDKDDDNIDLKIEDIKNQINSIQKEQSKVQSEFLKIFNTQNRREDKKLKEQLAEFAKTKNKLANELKKIENDNVNDNEPYIKLIKDFEELKHKYQNEPDNQTKKELRNKIDKAIIKIFEEKISEHIPELKRIEENAKRFPKEAQQTKYITEEKQKLTQKLGFDIEQVEKDLTAFTEGRKEKDFFLWNVYFAEVFAEKGGFDVVIGNPPYIQLQKAMNEKQKFADIYKNENFKTFERTGDIYALFYEKGINILTDKGSLCYITSNKWMRANYGKSLRRFFSKNKPLKLIDMGPGVFNTATVDTNIILVEKSNSTILVEDEHKQDACVTLATHFKNDYNKGDSIADYVKNNSVELTNLTDDSWIILSAEEHSIKQKIERIGTPLKDWDININYGIKTGFNEAFIIDGKTKDELISKDPKSVEIIKPILRGRDIKRYKAEFADLWLINTHNGYKNTDGKRIAPINIDNYPVIKEHLNQYWDKLEKRKDKGITPYNLRNCAYLEEFEKEKIAWKRIGSVIRFSYSENNELCLDSTVIGVGNNIKYLTALLNSKLHIRELLMNSPKTGTGDVIISVQALNPLKVHKPKENVAKPFELLVDTIIAKKETGEDTTAEEQNIDIMVYKLYDLTYDEVKIVDPEFGLTKEEYMNYEL